MPSHGSSGTGSRSICIAARALVFALGPLQRVAERTAQNGLPLATRAAANPLLSRPDAAYTAAFLAVMRDGHVTWRDDLDFMDVAEHVGLKPSQAAALGPSVEDDAVEGGG